jgi:antirestriction protein ArdC
MINKNFYENQIAITGDKKFIISASAKAQKAVNYLLNIEGGEHASE